LEKLVFGRKVQKNPNEIGKSDPVFQFWAKYRTIAGVQTRFDSFILPLRGGSNEPKNFPDWFGPLKKNGKKGSPKRLPARVKTFPLQAAFG